MNIEKEQAYQLQSLDGFLRDLNIKADSVSPGKSRISVPLEDNLCRFGGMMNGGAILTLSDFAGALCTLSLQDVLNNVTVSLNADFLMPVEKGPVEFEGNVEHEGKNLAFVTIKVLDADRNVCARVHGIWRLFR